jgi:hypothetical protein
MSTITLILQAVQILEPLIADLVKAIQGGTVDTFISTIPKPLRSRVVLNARKVLDVKP